MTDAPKTTHQRIRQVVAGDLKPVRPLLSPGRRLLLLIPIAIVAAAYSPAMATRGDLGRLGIWAAWGLSAVQWTIGLLILGVALRYAVPGRGISRRFLIATLAAAPATILTVTAITYAIEPSGVPPGMAFAFWWYCVRGPMIIAAPMLLVASVLAMRAYPTRPALVGALCGLAAGVLADSGWRLFCEVSSPSHILTSHSLAIVLMAGIGAGASRTIDSIRRRSK
jgi:hypothetical protein